MSRLSTRVNALLAEAQALRAAQAGADDPARDEALREELLGRINRLRENLSPEQLAASRAMLPATVEEIVASMREDLARRMATR